MDGIVTLDIDDLPRHCVDSISRSFISEAVTCYKNGAFRSCITNTWLAVVHNCIYKIDELALLGDREAIQQQAALRRIRSANDIASFLVFERSVLDILKDSFQLLDEPSLIDLKRIQEDRNRCVHPLLTSADEPYLPTPELARNHLIVAVSRLLREGVVYGKAVLEKVVELIDSPFFPTKDEDVRRVLDGSLLAKPRDSLFRNVIIVMLKSILVPGVDLRKQIIYRRVVKYLITKNNYLAEKAIAEKIDSIINPADPTLLSNVVHILAIDPMIWRCIPEDRRTIIKEFVSRLPTTLLGDMNDWLVVPELKPLLKTRADLASREELAGVDTLFPPELLMDRMIQVYLESPNFESANAFAHTICNNIMYFGRERILDMIAKIKDHSQVMGSFEIKTVIYSIRRASILPSDELNKALAQNGLAEYVK